MDANLKGSRTEAVEGALVEAGVNEYSFCQLNRHMGGRIVGKRAEGYGQKALSGEAI